MPKDSFKKEVLERDCLTCRICGGHNNLTVHHCRPKAKGGKGNLENCICLCTTCHRAYHKQWGLTESDTNGKPLQNDYRIVTEPLQKIKTKKSKKPHKHYKHQKKNCRRHYH